MIPTYESPPVTSGWNDINKGAGIVISGTDSNIATKAGSGFRCAKGNTVRSTGRRSFAVAITGNGGGNSARAIVGVLGPDVDIIVAAVQYPGMNGGGPSQPGAGWWSNTDEKT